MNVRLAPLAKFAGMSPTALRLAIEREEVRRRACRPQHPDPASGGSPHPRHEARVPSRIRKPPVRKVGNRRRGLNQRISNAAYRDLSHGVQIFRSGSYSGEPIVKPSIITKAAAQRRSLASPYSPEPLSLDALRARRVLSRVAVSDVLAREIAAMAFTPADRWGRA